MGVFQEGWNDLTPRGRQWVAGGLITLAVVFVIAVAVSPRPPQTSSVQPASAGSMIMPDYRGQTAGSAASAIRGSLGENVSVTAPGGDAGANAVITMTLPAPGALVTPATNFVLYTNYAAPAPVPVYTPPPMTTSEAPPATSDASESAGDSGSSDSDSSGGGSVDLPHVPHPHAHVCVGGRHIHVCS